MKIAILGGSFNPVHNGHLELARCARENMGYDKVLFVPTKTPPHKESDFGITDGQRIMMLKLAVENIDYIDVELCEIERGGVNYTFDTVTFLMEKYHSFLCENEKEGKPSKIGVILGTDLFSTFHLWHRAKELSEIADLILAHRMRKENFKGEKAFSKPATGGYAEAKNDESKTEDQLLSEFPFPHKVMKNIEIVASSSAIRMAQSKELDFSNLVPKKVFDFIKKEKLWKN